jgi:effector-binding domain-containing protein
MNEINKPTRKPIIFITVTLLFNLFAEQAFAIEEPKYITIKKSEDFELRNYEPKIIAQVQIDGDIKQASNKGFRLIANYIFGNNTAPNGNNENISMTAPVTLENQVRNEKISMTAPVTMEKQTNLNKEKWLMHFVMPSKYSIETLPKPNNPKVKIRRITDMRYAVIKFSGFTGIKKVEEKTNQLLNWMEINGLKPKGQPELARYNSPIALPFLRRNEVMISY